jgi:hypothetical protein
MPCLPQYINIIIAIYMATFQRQNPRKLATFARANAAALCAPSPMLRMVPLPHFMGEDEGRHTPQGV